MVRAPSPMETDDPTMVLERPQEPVAIATLPEFPPDDSDPVFSLPTPDSESRALADYRQLVADLALCNPIREKAVLRILALTGRDTYDLAVDVGTAKARLDALETLEENEPDVSPFRRQLTELAQQREAARREFDEKDKRLHAKAAAVQMALEETEGAFRKRRGKAMGLLMGDQHGFQVQREALFQRVQAVRSKLAEMQNERLQLLRREVWDQDVAGARSRLAAREHELKNYPGDPADKMPVKWARQIERFHSIIRRAEAAEAQAAAMVEQERALATQHAKEILKVFAWSSFKLATPRKQRAG